MTDLRCGTRFNKLKQNHHPEVINVRLSVTTRHQHHWHGVTLSIFQIFLIICWKLQTWLDHFWNYKYSIWTLAKSWGVNFWKFWILKFIDFWSVSHLTSTSSLYKLWVHYGEDNLGHREGRPLWPFIFYKTWRTNGTFSGPRNDGSCNIVHSKLTKIRSKNDIQIYLVKLGYPLIVQVLDNYSVDLIDSFDGWSRMIIPYWWPIRVDYTYERDMTKYKPFKMFTVNI